MWVYPRAIIALSHFLVTINTKNINKLPPDFFLFSSFLFVSAIIHIGQEIQCFHMQYLFNCLILSKWFGNYIVLKYRYRHTCKSPGASRWRVCYQRGLPRLVFRVKSQCRQDFPKGFVKENPWEQPCKPYHRPSLLFYSDHPIYIWTQFGVQCFIHFPGPVPASQPGLGPTYPNSHVEN